MSRDELNAVSSNAIPRVRRKRLKQLGLAAFLWAIAFALVSAYWALGGMLGADQLSPTLREQAERRETGFVVTLWGTAAIEFVGGLVPLALAFELWPLLPRRLVAILTWLGGALLTLYGMGDIVSGTIRATVGNDDGAIWYATLWGPIWLLGGVLYLGTAWLHRQVKSDLAT